MYRNRNPQKNVIDKEETSISSSFLFANTGLEHDDDVLSSPPRYDSNANKSKNGHAKNIKAKREKKELNNNHNRILYKKKNKNNNSNTSEQHVEDFDDSESFLPGGRKKYKYIEEDVNKLMGENNNNNKNENSYHDSNVDLLIAKLPPLTTSDRTLHMFHLPMPDCSSKPFNIL